VKYGFIISQGDVHTIPELAENVEAAGWDAVFIPDCISIETEAYPATEGYDPWVMLTVIAVPTIQKYMRSVRTTRLGGQKWSTFLRTYAGEIWACDVRRFSAYEILPGRGEVESQGPQGQGLTWRGNPKRTGAWS
jgi:hypothetical protein